MNWDHSPIYSANKSWPKSSPRSSPSTLARDIPTVNIVEPLNQEKRSLSEGSIGDLMEFERTRSASGSSREVMKLKRELDEQKAHFEEQISELEKKLDAESKIREMLRIRLMDEQKARLSAEERLEVYRSGIEDYCRRFGQMDISIS